MTFIPTASCGSINSRSNRSIKISRFPGCSVYCLNSTMGQQSSVMTQLRIPIMEKEREDSGVRSKGRVAQTVLDWVTYRNDRVARLKHGRQRDEPRGATPKAGFLLRLQEEVALP